jgi:hypothetical protein
MSLRSTKPFLDRYAELRDQVEHLPVIARRLARVDEDERYEIVEGVAAFLAEILLPHAAVEERVLYPETARLFGDHDDSDVVARDRDRVRKLLGDLASADVREVGELQETIFALYTLLCAHLWREEQLFVKLASAPDQVSADAVIEHSRQAGRRFARRSRVVVPPLAPQ